MIYTTTIRGCGVNAQDFLNEGICILFGEHAPDTLKDYCYIIDINNIEGDIMQAKNIKIGDNSYKIKKVGDMVERNLSSMGHLTIAFTDNPDFDVPGSIVVEQAKAPIINNNMKVEIY